jgi:two-component system OmpR family sensor kinase
MFDSVRVRLTFWYTGVLALALILLAVVTYLFYASDISERIDSNLFELSDAFVTTFHAELGQQINPDAVKIAAREAMEEHRFRDTFFALLAPDGEVLASSLELPALGFSSKEQIGPEIFRTDSFRSLVTNTPRGTAAILRNVRGGRSGLRAYLRPLNVGSQSYRLVVMQSLHPRRELLEDVRDTFLWIIPIVLVLASVGGYFLARKSLAPVVVMAMQAQNMGAQNLQGRLAVPNRRDELGQLALSFNQLLERLEQTFERQRRFISDASHELRTPVAILRGETDVTLSRPDRSPEEYRESLAILRDESQRLMHIIEDLFTLTRADAGQYPIALREFYLDELTVEVLHQARSLVIPKQIVLTSGIEPDLLFRGDEALLRRLLLNLLENAIKYTPVGGAIHLKAGKEANQIFVSVTDSGPGIPPDLHERIFERFFRVDKARARAENDTGGAGLGLSIARWIAEAHNGRLVVSRSDLTGSTFTASFPVQDVKATATSAP